MQPESGGTGIQQLSRLDPDDRRESVMDLSKFDGKHVRITDQWGKTFTGMAEYGNYDFLECEYGGDEDGIFIEDYLIYNSQVSSIEEIEVHGTVELWTERLILRRYRPEDAEPLHRYLGTDPAMYAYTGWNPYATLEMAEETVRRFIDGYEEDHVYSWVMDVDDGIVGTIGAYDYTDDQIEAGFSVAPGWQGRGLATEALKKVMLFLIVTLNKQSREITGLENSVIQLTVSFLTVAVFLGCKQGFRIPVPPESWRWILILGLINTGIGCYLYFSPLATLPVQTVAICGYLEPLSAVVFAAVLLGEKMTAVQIVGAVCIIGGAMIGELVKGSNSL